MKYEYLTNPTNHILTLKPFLFFHNVPAQTGALTLNMLATVFHLFFSLTFLFIWKI